MAGKTEVLPADESSVITNGESVSLHELVIHHFIAIQLFLLLLQVFSNIFYIFQCVCSVPDCAIAERFGRGRL